MASQTLVAKVEELQDLLVAYATGQRVEESEYSSLRAELLARPELRDKLPNLVWRCRSLKQFWPIISEKFSTYRGRRAYLWGEFGPVLQELEVVRGMPTDDHVSEILKDFDSDHVHRTWEMALQRRVNDPDGAVTSARSLLESVCKHILDEAGTVYAGDAELPALYRVVSEELRIAPSQQVERVVKQVLGNTTAVVEGVGALRNRAGDAHGKGQSSDITSSRVAELAINLAGTVALFLVKTWEEQKSLSHH